MPLFKEDSPLLTLIENNFITFLLLAWLLIMALLYQRLGIKVVHDSHRYLAYAESFSTGTSYWYHSGGISYFSYTLILYFIIYIINMPISVIILTQLIIGLLAVWCFYTTILNLSNSKITALIGTLFYISWPDLQQWHLYIHTESLYISIGVFIIYFLSVKQPTHKTHITIFILLSIGLFLRPNGFILLLGAIAFYLIGFKCKSKHTTNIVAGLSIVIMLVSIFALKEMLQIFSPLQYLEQGQIIQGYNGLNVPIRLIEVEDKISVLEQMYYTIVAQPFTFLKLLIIRFIFFWSQIKPYYSLFHNIIIILFFTFIYSAVIFAIRCKILSKKILAFIVMTILLQTLMAMFIAVDWDNRFVAPVLPFVFIIAALGCNELIIIRFGK
jgi:hypothetical protein